LSAYASALAPVSLRKIVYPFGFARFFGFVTTDLLDFKDYQP